MEILLTIFYTSIFIFLIYKFRFFKIDSVSRTAICIVFVLKICAGIFLFCIYTFYYRNRSEADIFKYFDDSRAIHQALHDKPVDYFKMMTGLDNDNAYFDEHYYHQMNNWYRKYFSNTFNDNHIIIRFNAFVRIFSKGFYQVHNVFMNFISLLGLVALFKFFQLTIKGRKNEIFFACFLIPSVIFWGSGVMKEGLLLFGIGFLMYYFHQLIHSKISFKNIFWIIVSVFILRYTKVYILAILFPLLISYYWVEKTSNKNILLKYFSVLFIYLTIVLSIKYISPQNDILKNMILKQSTFINMSESIKAGSLIKINHLQPNLSSVFTAIPGALYNSVFRPWFFEAHSFMILLNGLENLMFIIICGLSLSCFSKRIKNKNIFIFSIFFVSITFTLIGLITPVIGALVRYKMPVLPFMIIVFILISDKNKLKKFLKFIPSF